VKRLKILGGAVAMALALTAFVGASAASANWFKSEVEPETWSGSRAGKNHTLNLGGESFSCENVSFSGAASSKSVREITTTPELGNCVWVNGSVVGWATNGCKYRFNAGPGSELKGTVDITGCEKPMTLSAAGCTITIPNQSGLGPVTYKNVAGSPKTVTAIAGLTSITYTRSGVCGSGSAGTYSNGTYSGEWTVKGLLGGVPAGVEVEATSPAAPSLFTAEEAPVTLAASTLSSATYFKAIGGSLTSCKNYSLSGSSASASTSAITVTPTFKECTVGGEVVPDGFVTAGGCSYVFHVNGTFDIAGATCASHPMTVTRSGCISTIGPQSGISSEFTYTNQGSGKLRTVAIGGTSGLNITYTSVGSSCASEGTFSTGRILSSTTLSATNSGGAQQGLSVK
jgi:hypothetical protein